LEAKLHESYLGIGSWAAMQHLPECIAVGVGDLVKSDDLVNRGDLVTGDHIVRGNGRRRSTVFFLNPSEPSGADLRDCQISTVNKVLFVKLSYSSLFRTALNFILHAALTALKKSLVPYKKNF
jgi:hypothetical protein